MDPQFNNLCNSYSAATKYSSSLIRRRASPNESMQGLMFACIQQCTDIVVSRNISVQSESDRCLRTFIQASVRNTGPNEHNVKNVLHRFEAFFNAHKKAIKGHRRRGGNIVPILGGGDIAAVGAAAGGNIGGGGAGGGNRGRGRRMVAFVGAGAAAAGAAAAGAAAGGNLGRGGRMVVGGGAGAGGGAGGGHRVRGGRIAAVGAGGDGGARAGGA